MVLHLETLAQINENIHTHFRNIQLYYIESHIYGRLQILLS